jgi:hypothetical protein
MDRTEPGQSHIGDRQHPAQDEWAI